MSDRLLPTNEKYTSLLVDNCNVGNIFRSYNHYDYYIVVKCLTHGEDAVLIACNYIRI